MHEDCRTSGGTCSALPRHPLPAVTASVAGARIHVREGAKASLFIQRLVQSSGHVMRPSPDVLPEVQNQGKSLKRGLPRLR